uniref:Ig-like domain-containing protein n=1 Tax=Oryzias sinensis TaxID=183150 RepID=A0A8C7X2B3_9TELE
MFTTSLTETDGPFSSVNWNVNTTILVINYQSGSPFIPPGYQDRITFFPSTLSLELRDLTLDDGGEYGVNVFPGGGGGTIKLDIYVPVSSVTATPQSADLVEFSSFSLTCSSSGSSLSFIWMNSSSEVTASDRVQITDGGSTLTVVNVTRYDEQSYKCRVFNPVSEGISEPVNILVSYGPENTKISVSPSLEFYEEGSEVILSCSADSRPSAQFSWFLNGTKLPDSGPEFTLRNIQFSQRGDYSCQAFNSKTLTNEIIPGVSIKASTEQIIEGSSVTLTCEASGSSPSRKWKKDGSDLSLSENVTLSEDNKVLTFRAVNKDNSGEYVCLVSNPVSSSEAKFTPLLLTVNGPENVQIEGKDKINENDQIKLICSAESTPSATFTWRQNGSEIIGSSAEFLKEKAQLSDSGTYMCEALNTVTKAAFTLQVLMLISDFLTISDFFDDPSVTLTCEASGSSPSRKWKKDGSDLSLSENVTLSEDNKVVTFRAVNKDNSGEYVCLISNPISSSEAKFTFIVNYGPRNVQIEGKDKINENDQIKLICSAESTPSATFTWRQNGSEIIGSSAEFLKEKAQRSDSGTYTCEAQNNVTKKQATAEHELRVQTVSIKASTEQIIEGSSVTLTCESSGSSPSRKWKKDGSDLSLSENVTLSEDNKVLTFKAVNKDNSGEYVCLVSNPVSSSEAKSTFVVNYGPENISWYGRVIAGHRTQFTCSSSCFPNCVYSWTFKGRNVNGSTLAWTPDGQDDTVELQCTVQNPETGISSSTTTILEINNLMSVQVNPSNTVPTLNQSLNLVCLSAGSGDPKGPADLMWFKDGQKVTPRENVKFLRNNMTLHFDSVLPSDAGFYQCQTYLPSLQTKVISLGFLLSCEFRH